MGNLRFFSIMGMNRELKRLQTSVFLSRDRLGAPWISNNPLPTCSACWAIPRLHWMQPIENLKISLSYLLSPHTSSRYVFEGQTVKLKFSTVGWTVWCCGCRTPFIPSISRSKPHCSTMSRHFPIVFAVFPQFSIIFRIFPPGFHRFFPQFPWFPQPKRPTQMANGGHGTHVGVQVWSLGDHGLDGSRARWWPSLRWRLGSCAPRGSSTNPWEQLEVTLW